MLAADLPAVLAVQEACYGHDLIEPADALASRLVLSPTTCWVACVADRPQHLAAYLFTHPWPADSLPPLAMPLPGLPDDGRERVWFIHDMAVAPVGRGSGVALRLYDAARAAAARAGLRTSRLIAVQSAASWWERLGYAPVPAAQTQPCVAKLAAYGPEAVLMELTLD